MQFRLTDEQHMVRESAQAFLADVSSAEQVRKAMTQAASYDPEIWQRLCNELCLQAITVPEEYGGLGMSYVYLTIVLEQMGRKLFCSPFLATTAFATNAILLAASEQQKQRLLPAIAEGQTTTLAWTGPQAARMAGTWGAEAISATWQASDTGYVLDGEFSYVLDGDTAELLIVAARAPG
ncbi:MAG TPA: acyl-CoA dehydrogenase, partial [Gammaproteobacteria bacterium]|nr:acyl-CoA dehydrogenase [Gammaproteobacteria bacterium]